MSRVRRTFWVLVAVAVVATGSLSRALTADPGPATGVAVALAGLVALAAVGLALRILVVTGRAGRLDPDRRAAGGPGSARQTAGPRRRREMPRPINDSLSE